MYIITVISIFLLYIFYSHHGLFYIPIVYLQFPSCISIVYLQFPLWFVLYSHPVSSIPILVCFIFPSCIFNSHYGLYYIPILVCFIFPFYSHLCLFYIPILYLLFPSWFVLYSHCVSSIPILVCFIFQSCIFSSRTIEQSSCHSLLQTLSRHLLQLPYCSIPSKKYQQAL